jgi:homoserine dehydrogenase
MSMVISAAPNGVRPRVLAPAAPVRIALLGVGHVGGAVAGLLQQPAQSARFRIAAGLVRDLWPMRSTAIPMSSWKHSVAWSRPGR